MNYHTLIRQGALADAQVALGRLGADLQDAGGHLTKEHLKLASGWHQLDTTTKDAQGRAEATITESKKEDAEAKEAHDSALAEVVVATKRRGVAEASLKAL